MFAGSRDEEGIVVGGIIVTRDVTDEAHALEDLERRERDFRVLTEEASDLLARHELDGTYLYVSPASRRLFGFEPEELLGRNSYDNIHPDDVPRLRQRSATRSPRATRSSCSSARATSTGTGPGSRAPSATRSTPRPRRSSTSSR